MLAVMQRACGVVRQVRGLGIGVAAMAAWLGGHDHARPKAGARPTIIGGGEDDTWGLRLCNPWVRKSEGAKM